MEQGKKRYERGPSGEKREGPALEEHYVWGLGVRAVQPDGLI